MKTLYFYLNKKKLYKHVSSTPAKMLNVINVEDPSMSRLDHSTGPTLGLHMIIKRLAATARTAMTTNIRQSFSLPQT